MKTTITEGLILETVAEYFGQCDPDDNWADGIDTALIDAGIEMADTRPDGSDPWDLAHVVLDGSQVSIYLHDESRDSGDRYRYGISELETEPEGE